MTYLVRNPALGAVMDPDEPWCSPEHPSGSCSPSAGMAKPMTTAALNAFKALQDQLNRVASIKSWSKVPVDGRIGSGTVALYNKVAAAKGYTLARDHNHLADGASSGAAARWVSEFASSLGAPAYVAPPVWPPSVPSKASPSGGMPMDPPAVGLIGQMTAMGPLGLVVVAGAGFVGYKLIRGRKGKGNTKWRPGKRPRRRR